MTFVVSAMITSNLTEQELNLLFPYNDMLEEIV
jgi:hypothetical protein